MNNLKKVLGTSILTLLLVIWGLFMVCSGRVPEVQYEDDLSSEQAYGKQDPELMSQLAALDDQSNNLDAGQRQEILSALGIDAAGAGATENNFLSEELFLDLEVEIAELEKANQEKEVMTESLRLEIEEADHQLAALGTVVDLSTTPSLPAYAGTGSLSPYALAYQDALNDVYAHRKTQAIVKFEDMLRMENTDNLADNAQYWIGECYYAMGQYERAIAEFEKVYAYDNNNKIDDAQFMIGMAYAKVGEQSMAQTEFLNLLSFFQNSEYVPRAETRLNDLRI
jgi:TolA-binding protein